MCITTYPAEQTVSTELNALNIFSCVLYKTIYNKSKRNCNNTNRCVLHTALHTQQGHLQHLHSNNH